MESLLCQLDGSPLSHSIEKRSLEGEELSLLRIEMPDGESALLFMPLPSFLSTKDYSMQEGSGIYHHVKPSALYALQPRRTLCYSHAYNYSKTQHPVEKETPVSISKIYDVTNKLFGLEEGVNMDLVNYYPTGRHYISAHSDDERQFGKLKDVYCWLFGPAARLGIFRSKEDKKEVLRLSIPEGLYVMEGLSFQRNYTHEFPQIHPALFTRLCKALCKEESFPSVVEKSELGASRDGIVHAEWIKANKVFVREFITEGNVSKGKKIEKDLESFEEWLLERTSHTLRQFVQY